ncbi:hypothetical protein HYDPIDRAFT_28282 [Hydnomerulius pinastri MD-312]|uniref:DUF6533 domain-containing protein n=1 Tax=Hydnomerulius pinastri MD-312 TaxID=994086 RepID=A0A0C9WFL4_9AGAM|nr:hypothetical protein HYDPIDRAFT_28282 [Hydnomerulius pinastri MD-312]
MASEAAAVYAGLQFNNYVSVGIVAAVSYDYILTFLQEVEYIWLRPWTLMSMMFLVIRYFGLTAAMSYIDTSFINESVNWANLFFKAVADLVMILRIHAMYNRSRLVLGILLAVYISAIIFPAVSLGIYFNPNTHLSVEVINVVLCTIVLNVPSQLTIYLYVPELVLSSLLCIFALVRFVTHALEMRRALGKWQSNRYMKLLVQESILYYIVGLYFNIMDLVWFVTLAQTSGFPGNLILVPMALSLIGPYVLAPRLVISVREFHSRVVGEDIDSGFGLGSQRLSISDYMFAAQEENPEEEVERRDGMEEVARGVGE